MQINKAVDLESAMLEASSSGLLAATAFDASSLRIVAVIVLILLVYARTADAHEPTAVVRAFYAVANCAAAIASAGTGKRSAADNFTLAAASRVTDSSSFTCISALFVISFAIPRSITGI